MGTLIYTPLVHDPYVDMGCRPPKPSESWMVNSLGKSFRNEFNRFWDEIDSYLADKQVGKIYQDSLFHSNPRARYHVAKALAQRGSRNFQTVCTLVERGAALMKSERLALYLSMHAAHTLPACVSSPLIKRIMNARDRSLTRRICAELGEDETAVLFIGVKHEADKHILKAAPHIRIEHAPCSPERAFKAYALYAHAYQNALRT